MEAWTMRKNSGENDSRIFGAQSPVPVARLRSHPLDALDVGRTPVALAQ